ncbi:DapE [Fructilactobacillus florum 8D]|uniref:DapE n=1 Tax=Fructilactobacillus florum 8D TaxID=1221538 RepID=W9EFX2_9LACO|nr:ArgE/DapE family deacylase [Fructilactobacillus florum]EKK20742.1 DapE [Fructilactobacillus florum 2F]ETO40952.1 DapE [Fructilactobacillus florum 8D]
MQRAEKLKIYEKLVAFDTSHGHERPAALYVQTLLQTHGIASQIIPMADDHANLVAELGTGQAPVLVASGHLDTVAIAQEEWETDPFVLTSKHGQVYGSGVTDMKGGVAALLIAMIELHDAQVPLAGTLRLVLTADEEGQMSGSRYLQSEQVMKQADALLIAEPTGYRVVYANKGEVDLRITAQGRAAHSSRPNFGINAIQNLMDFLELTKQRIESQAKAHPDAVLGQTTSTVDIFRGGIQINSIPAQAEAELNLRVVPAYANQAVLADFKQLLSKFNAEHAGELQLEVLMNIPPVIGEATSPLIEDILQIATPYLKNSQYNEAELKLGQHMQEKQGFNPFDPDEIVVMGASGGTDGSELLQEHLQGFPYAVFGPGNPIKMHQSNESADLAMWFDYIEIYKELFQRYLG